MIVRRSIICLLALLSAAAAFPAIFAAKTVALVHAAPVLASLIEGAKLRAGDDVTGIVVLGGSVERVREAMELAKRYPKATVLLTGPGDEEKALALSTGSVLSRLLLDLRARNTFQNGMFSRELAQPGPEQRWILVTSAVHMPRAMTVFCSVGFQVEPWPVQDTPSSRQEAARQAQHELLGLLAYRLLGRTRAIIIRSHHCI